MIILFYSILLQSAHPPVETLVPDRISFIAGWMNNKKRISCLLYLDGKTCNLVHFVVNRQ